jgi:hypothetical protein
MSIGADDKEQVQRYRRSLVFLNSTKREKSLRLFREK